MGTDLHLVVKLNGETKLEKIQRIVDNWRRNLTIIGRMLIINTLLISQIVQLIMYWSVPQNVIKIWKILYLILYGIQNWIK